MIDKIFFMDKINNSIKVIFDYGCADGALISEPVDFEHIINALKERRVIIILFLIKMIRGVLNGIN